MIIEEKMYLYALLCMPLLGLFFFAVQWWKRKARSVFSEKSAFNKLAPERSTFKIWIKFAIFILVLVNLIVGIANPKIGTQLQTIKREGIDIVFAVDVSKSMLAEDIKPNRLEKAKRIVSEIIHTLQSDRVGLVAYAGQAYPLLPLTNDYAAVKMFLQHINTDMLSSHGTAIQEAIRVGMDYFQEQSPTSRLMFVLSDGEDHQAGAESWIHQAQEKGIRIYTIGVGTPKGATIPEKQGTTTTIKKDANGQVVITKLNRMLLEELAQQGKGIYFEGNQSTNQIVTAVEKALKNIDKNEYETQMFSDYKDQFQWFLGIALVLLLIDIFVSYRKTQWIRKFNLFGEKTSEK